MDPFDFFFVKAAMEPLPLGVLAPHAIAAQGLHAMNQAGHDLSSLAAAHTHAQGVLEAAKRSGSFHPSEIASADRVLRAGHQQMANKLIQGQRAQQYASTQHLGERFGVNPLGHPAISPNTLAAHVTDRILAKSSNMLALADDLAVPAIHMLLGNHEAEAPEPEHPTHQDSMPKLSRDYGNLLARLHARRNGYPEPELTKRADDERPDYDAMIGGAATALAIDKSKVLNRLYQGPAIAHMRDYANTSRMAPGDAERLVADFHGRSRQPVKLHHITDPIRAHQVNGEDIKALRDLGMAVDQHPQLRGLDAEHSHIRANLEKGPGILAHELGHTTEGRAFRAMGMVSRGFSPHLRTGAALMGNDNVTAAAVAAGLPTLASEAHASYQGYKAIERTMGAAAARKSIAPLAAAFGSYAIENAGAPLAAHFAAKKVRELIHAHNQGR